MERAWWELPWFSWPVGLIIGFISGFLSGLAANIFLEKWRHKKLTNKEYFVVSSSGSKILRFEGQYKSSVRPQEIINKLFGIERPESTKKEDQIDSLHPHSISIVSDEKTIFTGATAKPALQININAVPAKIHPNWVRVDKKFPQLRDAKWIADREHITNDEAIDGGQYTFVREFEIPVDKNQIDSAEIYILVDNFCELRVNGTRIQRFEGFDKLHRISILNTIQKGRNVAMFVITNEDFTRYNNPAHKQFYESDRQWEHNPYGFKYCIEIKYLGR